MALGGRTARQDVLAHPSLQRSTPKRRASPAAVSTGAVLHRLQRGVRCRAGLEGWQEVLTKARQEPWDAAPRSWRDFWAVKLAAAMVENDAQAGEVRVTPVENHGLRAPRDADDAWARARTNLVLYRQNYALCALAIALGTALRSASLVTALASAVVAITVGSNRLLGELALASGNRLVWNSLRVAGFDRRMLRASAGVCALLCWASSPREAASWALRTVLLSAVAIALHAILRPVDLTDAVASFIGDLGGVKSREDVGKAFSQVGNRFSQWFKDARQQPAEPVPIVVVQKGAAGPVQKGPGKPQQQQLPGA